MGRLGRDIVLWGLGKGRLRRDLGRLGRFFGLFLGFGVLAGENPYLSGGFMVLFTRWRATTSSSLDCRDSGAVGGSTTGTVAVWGVST